MTRELINRAIILRISRIQNPTKEKGSSSSSSHTYIEAARNPWIRDQLY